MSVLLVYKCIIQVQLSKVGSYNLKYQEKGRMCWHAMSWVEHLPFLIRSMVL